MRILGGLLAVAATAAAQPYLTVSPLVPGLPTHLAVHAAAPGAAVYFLYAPNAGSAQVPGLGSLALGPGFHVLSIHVADAEGAAALTLAVPSLPALLQKTAHFQAAVLPGGHLSRGAATNPVRATVRPLVRGVLDHGKNPTLLSPGKPGGLGFFAGKDWRFVRLKGYPRKAVFHPDGSRAFVLARDGTVQVVDLQAGRVRTTLVTAWNALDVALSADGRHLHVLCDPSPPGPTALFTFDARELVAAGRATLPPWAFALLPAGPRRLVVLHRNRRISVLAENALRGSYPVGRGDDTDVLDALYPERGGERLYVLTGRPPSVFPFPLPRKPGHVEIVHLPTGRVVASRPVGRSPVRLALTAQRLLVLHRKERSLHVLDRDNLKTLATLTLPRFTLPSVAAEEPAALAAVPGSPWVTVLIPGQPAAIQTPVPGRLLVYDVQRPALLRAVALAADFQADLAVDGANLQVLVPNEFARTVEIYDLRTGALRDRRPAGVRPRSVVVR